MSSEVYCPSCGACCGETGWTPRMSHFNCPTCNHGFEANGMGEYNTGVGA